MDKSLTHINEKGNAAMVDVSDKNITNRIAVAIGKVVFPDNVFQQLKDERFLGKKGSVLHTAIIAGIQAAKKTSDLIPLCHPLSLNTVEVDIEPNHNDKTLQITSTVKCSGKTGVEMEALTATSIAALTIYDMTKALSHNIVISEIKLKEKRGGKQDVTN